MNEKTSVFPKDFLFGTATASYQIEGAAWEDGRGCSIWDTFSRTPNKVFKGHTGDVACDHYHRYQEDIDLMQALGANAYRFSAAWPRIYPNGYGKVNQPGLDFYDRLTDALLQAKIKPCLTLYHWDLPQRLEDEGGWTARSTAEHFVGYADTLLARIGDRMHSVITLNEPWCSATLGYLNGAHAPGRCNLRMFLAAVHHLLLAHGKAQEVIRARAPQALSGIALNLQRIYPHDPDRAEDCKAAEMSAALNNRMYLDPIYKGEYPAEIQRLLIDYFPPMEAQDLQSICQTPDFLGINYYFPVWLTGKQQPSIEKVFAAAGAVPLGIEPLQVITGGEMRARDDLPKTAMNWPVYPAGLTQLLVQTTQDYNIQRLFITENGSAWEDKAQDGSVQDRQRGDYLRAHLQASLDAMQEGVPLAGYYCWSLMDNFEWAEGYAKRFGLFYCDYDRGQQRLWKESARVYQQIIKQGHL